MFKFVKISLALAAVCAVTVTAAACGSSGGGSTGSAAPAQPSAANYSVSSEAAAEDSADITEMYQEDGGLGGEFAGTVAEDLPVEEGGEATPPENIRDDRKIIWRADMTLETLEFDEALAQIEQLINEKGGYIETQSVDSGSIIKQHYDRNASITARIPSAQLDSFANGVAGICNVVSRSKSSEDITDSYFDSTARLETLIIQEERLLEILKKAEKLEDVITLENALSGVRYEIETLTATIRRMDSQTAFSYMDMKLLEVAKFKEVTEVPKTFGEELSVAASRSGQHLLGAMRTLALVLVEGLPLMIFWGIIILAIALAVRAIFRRVRAQERKKYAKKDALPKASTVKPPENQQENEKK